MRDAEDRTLHGLLAIVGGVPVMIGVATQRYGAEATLGLLMMTLGLAAFVPRCRPPSARVVRTTPWHRA